ncbi:MAG TPA: SLBB domain-containing protein [Sedimentisphaerales bacterium]|nr:SLBB domain-containing protein [Sedimentisphaerales bacterium]
MRACLPSPGLGFRFVVAVLVLSGGMGTRSATAQSLFDVPGLGNRPQSGSSGLSNDRLSQLARERLRSGAASAESPEPNEAAPPDLRTRPAPPQTPSRIELLLSRDASLDVNDVSLRLKQFGYDMFGAPVSTFAPVTNVPVGPDYVIGPGDGFTLTLWGRVDAQHTLQVDRSGQIVLPEVGALRVWGMKFGELESYLRHELSRKFTDFKMSIAMDRLRTIQVFVVGEATAPGTYTVSSLSTAINAIFAAGGPSRNGTLRKIRLSRSGQEPISLDLYDLLMGGDKSQDVRLQDADTIFIPLIGPVVGVAGNVKRPAIYEMTGPMTLHQVLDLAGGVAFSGWLQRVQVERVHNHERQIVVDFDLSRGGAGAAPSDPNAMVLQDGDIVKVFAVPAWQERMIRLEGHVVRAGKREWKPGMRLSGVLTSYDLLMPQPDTEYAQIERLVPPDLHPVVIPFNVGKLLAGDQSQDLELAQYDAIRVFRWDERTSRKVTISGMVFDPNVYRLIPDMRVGDLIDAAGGLHKNAYLRTSEITRRHISQEGMATEKIDVDLEKALAGDPEHNVLLRDYDHVVVRPIPDLVFDANAVIDGEVRFPGRYPIRKGETLSSLIERAGGYTDQAYLKGAVFTRQSARAIQRRRLDDLIRQIEESMLSSAQEQMSASLDAESAKIEQVALETKKALLARLRAAEITGRVVVRLDVPEEFKGSRYDMELEDGDKLTVPPTPGVVHVVGEVFNPTSLLYEENGTVSYYLGRVGGMTKEADKKQVSVIKADGTVISMEQGNRGKLLFWDSQSNSWFFGGFLSHRMEPGDTVVVPRKVDKYLNLRLTKDITQIIFQIAVAAGVVFAI